MGSLMSMKMTGKQKQHMLRYVCVYMYEMHVCVYVCVCMFVCVCMYVMHVHERFQGGRYGFADVHENDGKAEAAHAQVRNACICVYVCVWHV